MRRVVVDLNSPRPVWRAPRATVRAIRETFGGGWRVTHVRATASSDGDGSEGSVEAVRAARGAEVYIGWGVPASVARAAHGSLRWAHTAAAGVGASLTPELAATGARLTNSPGVQSEPMADWVLAAIGYCLRGFHTAVTAQGEARWAKDDLTDGNVPVREFAGTPVGIVGLGSVGRAVARRCAALGMPVAGVRRRPTHRRPAGVQWVGGADDLVALARRSHVLVIATPHTPDTGGLIDARVLRALPRHAFVINVGRGAVLDEPALLDGLDRGRLAGCVLDVFEREPLPRRHPMWRHPRVMVFPHASAVSPRFWERQTALIAENIARYLSGRRLRHTVDFQIGY